MLFMLVMISLTASVIFIFVKHPLSLGLILLIQTITISLIMGFFNWNFWYSYILFLIMIGGMLVLFIYMTSVASNEKFSFSKKLALFVVYLMVISLTGLLTMDMFFPNINNMNLESIGNNFSFVYSLNKFINSPMSIIMYMMIIYLLITLIAVVKITNIKSGPLRQTH